jgi:hypothetical protein
MQRVDERATAAVPRHASEAVYYVIRGAPAKSFKSGESTSARPFTRTGEVTRHVWVRSVRVAKNWRVHHHEAHAGAFKLAATRPGPWFRAGPRAGRRTSVQLKVALISLVLPVGCKVQNRPDPVGVNDTPVMPLATTVTAPVATIGITGTSSAMISCACL